MFEASRASLPVVLAVMIAVAAGLLVRPSPAVAPAPAPRVVVEQPRADPASDCRYVVKLPSHRPPPRAQPDEHVTLYLSGAEARKIGPLSRLQATLAPTSNPVCMERFGGYVSAAW